MTKPKHTRIGVGFKTKRDPRPWFDVLPTGRRSLLERARALTQAKSLFADPNCEVCQGAGHIYARGRYDECRCVPAATKARVSAINVTAPE